MKRKSLLVSIIMGSDSDLPIMKDAAEILDEFDIGYEIKILSAHRSPKLVHRYTVGLVKQGIKVVIAGAGGAAHLAGVVSSLFPLPVIGVPMKTPTLGGNDSLYSTVQMPGGVPVATVGIGSAQNAALLAVQILAVSDRVLMQKLLRYKQQLEKKVQAKTKKLDTLGIDQYLAQMKK